MFVAIGCLYVAGGAAIIYLIEEALLRRHRLGGVLGRLPSLATLETLVYHATLLGLPFLTMGMVAGIIRAETFSVPHWWVDPMVLLSLGAWAVYLVSALGSHARRLGRQPHRLAGHRRPRRAVRHPLRRRAVPERLPHLRRLTGARRRHRHLAQDRLARAARASRPRRRRRPARGAGAAGRRSRVRGRRSEHLQPHRALHSTAGDRWRRARPPSAVLARHAGVAVQRARAEPLQLLRRRGHRASLPRHLEPRFDGRRRGADRRSDEGRIPAGLRGRLHERRLQPPVPARPRSRQARAHRDGHRRTPGERELRGRRAGPPGVRQVQGPHRAHRRRRRDQRAHRHAPQGARHREDPRHQPHVRRRRGAGPSGRRPRRALRGPRRAPGGRRHRHQLHLGAALRHHARARRAVAQAPASPADLLHRYRRAARPRPRDQPRAQRLSLRHRRPAARGGAEPRRAREGGAPRRAHRRRRSCAA